MINRRDAAALGAAWLAWAGQAKSQTARPAGKIGYLHPRLATPEHSTVVALRSAWRPLGYVEGESVLLRAADGDMRRVPALVAEMVAQGAGVLIVVGAAALKAAHEAAVQASTDKRPPTPIVAIDLETDPVRAGYAASMGRPGGHVTGLFLDQPSLAGKWIDLLREAVPELGRLAILWDRATGLGQVEVAMGAARSKGLETQVLELGTIKNFDLALRALAGKPPLGIVQLTSPGSITYAAELAAAAQRYRLPTITFQTTAAHAGLMLSYGPMATDYFPRAAVMADKILRGAKPGDVPIEGPSRYEFVINLKTAKAMGISIPQSVLLRADEVIR